MKSLIVGSLLALLTLSTVVPAEALVVGVGPRGGVRVGVGGFGYRGYGYRGYGYRGYGYRGFGYRGGYGYRGGFRRGGAVVRVR